VEKLAKWCGLTTEELLYQDIEKILKNKSSDSNLKLDNNVDLNNKINIEGDLVPVISWVAAGSFTDVQTVLKDTEVIEW
ncbi:peptidase S24, partial [Acinetobacter baumannii]|nr:peptidase S24 [Acinetobacter baumannii]